MNERDALLLDRWSASKDVEAFNELMNRYLDLVFATARRILRNDEDAKDIAQECFLRLMQGAETVHTSVGAWLHALATHRALDRLRADSRRRNREVTFAESGGAETVLKWDDVYELVDDAICCLDDELRIPLVAHYFEGKSYTELAGELKLTRQTVSARVSDGIARIREQLSARGKPLAAAPLTTLLIENATTAAPASLRDKLTKYAFSGLRIDRAPSAADAPRGARSFAGFYKASVAIVFMLIVAGIAFWSLRSARTDTDTQRAVNASPVRIEAAEVSPGPSGSPASAEPVLVAQLATDPPTSAPVQADDTGGPGRIVVVVQTRDGTPAAGADVVLEHVTWEPFTMPPAEVLSFKQKTDASGRVTFNNLPLGEYGCIATLGLFAYADGATVSQENLNNEILLKLVPGRPMEGSVRDSSGAPVPFAVVYPFSSPIIREAPFSAFAAVRTRADATGRFSYPVMVPIPFVYCVVSEKYARTLTPLISNTGKPIDLVVYRGGYVAGKAVKTGSNEVLAATRVAVLGGPGNQRTVTTTSGSGDFEIGPLQQGDYTVEIAEPGIVAAQPYSLRIADGQRVEGFRIEASTGSTVSGTVRDPITGKGIPGVVVRAYSNEPGGQEVVLESAQTDASGAYAIFGFSEGTYTLAHSSSGPYADSSRPVEIVRGQDLEGVDFLPNKGVLVRGTVYDASGQAAVQIVVSFRDGAGNALGRTTTLGQGGRFEYLFTEPVSAVSVRALTMFGSSDWTPPVAFDGRDVYEINLRATRPRESAIRGRIVNAAGQPLPFVSYWAVMDESNQVSTVAGRFDVSGPEGRFNLAKLHAGTYSIIAGEDTRDQARELGQRITVEQGQTIDNVEIVYGDPPDGVITGRVRGPSGQPVQGVRVVAEHSRRQRSAESAADGSFRLDHLGVEQYHLAFKHPQYASEYVGPVAAGDPPLDVRLQSTIDLVLRVVDAATQNPIDTVSLLHTKGRLNTLQDQTWLVGPSGMRIYIDAGDFRSLRGTAGEYRIEGAESGETVLVIVAEGFVPFWRELSLSATGGSARVDIQLQAGATIRGRLLGSGGVPIAGGSVRTGGFDGIDSEIARSSTQSNDRGEFVLEGLAPGKHLVNASAAGYAAKSLELEAIVGGGRAADVRLEVAGGIDGAIANLTEFGSGAYILVRPAGDRNAAAQSMEASVEGRFAIDNLAPGAYEVAVLTRIPESRTTLDWSLAVTVESGRHTQISALLPRGDAQLSGIATINGAPIAGAIIFANYEMPSGVRVVSSTYTGGAGAYELHGLPAGACTLVASFGDESTRAQSVHVAAGSSQRVDLN